MAWEKVNKAKPKKRGIRVGGTAGHRRNAGRQNRGMARQFAAAAAGKRHTPTRIRGRGNTYSRGKIAGQRRASVRVAARNRIKGNA